MRAHSVIPIAILGLTIHSARALAQSDVAEVGEISVYAGSTAGGLGTHATVGSGFGRAFSRYTIGLIDTSYAPLGARTLRTYSGAVTTNSRLYDLNFSVHIRVPVQQRWAPYAIVGSAFLFNTYEKQVLQGSVAHLAGETHTAFGFETGAGARYYAGESWGVRAEYRYTLSTHNSHNFSRVLGGVFYQFEGEFPLRIRHGRRRGQGEPY